MRNFRMVEKHSKKKSIISSKNFFNVNVRNGIRHDGLKINLLGQKSLV